MFVLLANFHLRNGASLWRINWLGNTSERGFNSSYGLMVNYRYDLKEIEKNNEEYVMNGRIATSDTVRTLLGS